MKRAWFQYRLRTLLLAIPILCLSLAVMTLKLRQDREFDRAWHDLATIGMSSSIGPGKVKLVSNRTAWSHSDVNQLVQTIEILGKRHDLGLTEGLKISIIDFKNSQISDESIARIRHVLPNADIRK